MEIRNGMKIFFTKHKVILLVLLITLVFIPLLSFGAEDKPLVPCDECGFSDFMALVNNVVGFILFRLVLPIAAIMFAYAGFLLLFSGGEQAKRTKAKSIFINVAMGLVLALAAWLIIHTIFVILGYKGGAWVGF